MEKWEMVNGGSLGVAPKGETVQASHAMSCLHAPAVCHGHITNHQCSIEQS